MPSSLRIQFKGLPQLRRRVAALDDLGPFMRDLALSAVNEQKHLAPVRTGNLRRTIHVGRITARSAETIASAEYARFVEFGTRAHEIRPRSKKALHWKGARHPVRRVQHPGTRAQPFMIPGAERAIAGAKGLRERIVAAWNAAA